MSRDTAEKEVEDRDSPVLSDAVSVSWHDLMGHPARAYLREVLLTLDLDLIFVEDGVGFRGLRRVMRFLFEHYDIQRRRIEERHLTGIVGIRCVIHDFEIGEPWRREGYAEPDYAEVGRARILHVLRDRGEEDEPLEVPVDRTDVPVLVS